MLAALLLKGYSKKSANIGCPFLKAEAASVSFITLKEGFCFRSEAYWLKHVLEVDS